MKPIALVQRIFGKLTELQWVWILVARLGVGCEFFLSGWGKLHRLDKLIAYFHELKIRSRRFKPRSSRRSSSPAGFS